MDDMLESNRISAISALGTCIVYVADFRYFDIRTCHRGLWSKLEAKFCTFWTRKI